MFHHAPPLRVDIAILLIVITITALVTLLARARRRARRRPDQIRVNLVGTPRDPDRP